MDILIDDIKDKESLDAWLNERPEEVRKNCGVFIASRASLRVLPIAAGEFEFSYGYDNNDLTAITFLRLMITQTVGANLPTFDERYATVLERGKTARAAIRGTNAAADPVVFSIADWDAIRFDIQLWLDRAAADEILGVDCAPLWEGENPLASDWVKLRNMLSHDDQPKRGADWSFWIKWYEDILAGRPQNWDMLYEIATSEAIDWDASPREVNEAIARIVEGYDAVENSADKQGKASTAQVQKVKTALQSNFKEIPYTVEAVEFLISNEIERLQSKNYQDDLEMEEAKRLISILLVIMNAVEGIARNNVGGAVKDENAEEVLGALATIKTEFCKWPKENAPELVDGVFRAGLVGGVTGLFALAGAPAMIGAAVGGVIFGGSKMKDGAKVISDAVKSSSGIG